MSAISWRRIAAVLFVASALALLAARSGALQAVLEALSGHQIPVQGTPVAAAHATLSEHEKEYIQGLPPQQQAEELMQASVNHDVGATAMIMEKLPAWEKHLQRTQRWDALELTARYSNDLRVRAAAIEIDLLVMHLDKEEQSANRLIDSTEHAPASRPSAAYYLGMLANRGVEPARIHDLLKQWAHDPDEQTRYWAVEGLAFLGTEETIEDFLDVLRNDPSMNVRERGGCSLAKSGMLTREQRLKAVPGLIEIGDDPAVNATTRNWAFQALREITAEAIGNDASAWRNWFSSHGTERAEQFRRDQNQLLGNS